MANRGTTPDRRRGQPQPPRGSRGSRPPPLIQLGSPSRQHSLDEAAQVAQMRQLVHDQEQQITQELAHLRQMEQATGVGHEMPLMPQMPTMGYPANMGPCSAPFVGYPQQMASTWPLSQPHQPMMAFSPQQMMPFPQQAYSASYQQYAPQHFGDPPPTYHQPGYGSQPPLSPLSPQTQYSPQLQYSPQAQYSAPATYPPQGAPLPYHPPLPPEPHPEAGPRMALGFLPVEQQQQLSDQLHTVVLPEVGAEHAHTVTLMLLDHDLPYILKMLTSAQDRSQGALPRSVAP